MFKTLKLPRVTLRLITHKHAAQLFTILNNQLVAQFNDYKTPLSKADIKQLIQDDINGYYEGNVIRVAIEHNINGNLIGTCGLYKIEHKSSSAFIGFELAPFFWQQGLMSEVLVGFIDALPSILQIDQLFAQVNTQNIRSHTLLTKLGFELASEAIIKSADGVNDLKLNNNFDKAQSKIWHKCLNTK
ncbi:ribosomal-protein-alanine N-acetyltransferase [Pseudoalteromonas sp. BSi20652]|uniref:GNAT family N-acetyltransferase n=1 Tax=Pseudoalteromonas sp. BSi20652 TaxID=388384 RepID=UPI0002319654|nr:GNAT family N-acetyltransferase [Pseudoalteromonas sp. BSi20652]GAA59445.1 ribosomal-protein-alanine N-acetyltransferase [Pseudoalteromonas sp. BSi20652]